MSTGTSMADPAAGRAAGEPRTAFVLAGGAALGAMQAGMVHALYERGIAPDLVIGTSVGALNGRRDIARACACTGPDTKSSCPPWRFSVTGF